MKVKVICIGKSNPAFVKDGIGFFQNKIKHFCDFEWVELVPKKKSEWADNSKKIDAELMLQNFDSTDYIILLDERGKQFASSFDFSQYINKKQLSGVKRIVFIVGGSFGFDETIYQRAQEKISLAPMTFSHQIIRLIFLEQLYRGFAILHNLPYHHE